MTKYLVELNGRYGWEPLSNCCDTMTEAEMLAIKINLMDKTFGGVGIETRVVPVSAEDK